jgi:uridine kinase
VDWHAFWNDRYEKLAMLSASSIYSFQMIVEQTIQMLRRINCIIEPFFIPIGGPDAVGKTRLARKLKEELQDAVIFTTDHYLSSSRKNRMLAAQTGKSGYLLEMHYQELLFSDLRRLRARESVADRRYDSINGTTSELPGEYLGPAKYILVDSGLSLTDAFWQVYPPGGVFGIFIFADQETRRVLKAQRDGTERNYEQLYREYDDELIEMFIQQNLNDCETIVMPTAKKANVIAEIDSNYRVRSMRVLNIS